MLFHSLAQLFSEVSHYDEFGIDYQQFTGHALHPLLLGMSRHFHGFIEQSKKRYQSPFLPSFAKSVKTNISTIASSFSLSIT